MLVVLSRDHMATGGPRSARSTTHTEDILTRKYMAATEDRLIELGHSVIIISDDNYRNRHERAKDYRAHAYIACHVNAGFSGRRQPFGAFFYDNRSEKGKALAKSLSTALVIGAPAVLSCRTFSAHPDGWTAPAYNTIRGVYDGRPVGICAEPFFLDCEEHSWLLHDSALVRVGTALAEGLHAWYEDK